MPFSGAGWSPCTPTQRVVGSPTGEGQDAAVAEQRHFGKNTTGLELPLWSSCEDSRDAWSSGLGWMRSWLRACVPGSVGSVWVGVCCCPPMEEVAKAFFRQAMEASNMHMLLLEGDFSTLLSPGRASKQIYPRYFVIILRLSVLFLLSLLQVVDLKPSH